MALSLAACNFFPFAIFPFLFFFFFFFQLLYHLLFRFTVVVFSLDSAPHFVSFLFWYCCLSARWRWWLFCRRWRLVPSAENKYPSHSGKWKLMRLKTTTTKKYDEKDETNSRETRNIEKKDCPLWKCSALRDEHRGTLRGVSARKVRAKKNATQW